MHHLRDQIGETGSMSPTEHALGLRWGAEQKIDLGRPKIAWIDTYHRAATCPIDAGFVDALAAPLDGDINLRKGVLNKLANTVRFAGGEHIVVRLRLLQNTPHAFDIFAGVAPVALGIEVADVERLLQAEMNAVTARVILRVTKVSPRSGLS